ncbi:MAG: ATP-binding cassette domain-containing protein [Rhodospirillaceae bacterium]|jgi:ABC transport system ATP-binding/permease protein|nr:ATP-binding cassette domain-containing protein [Rhodospirillaceae bacterium]
MAPPLLLLSGIGLGFGGEPLLTGAELSVMPGQRLCLVGRNGSGKSTLLKIAAGMVEADEGERFVQPGTTVRYLSQEPDLAGFDTTRAYAEAGMGPGDDPYRAQYCLEHLGLTGDEDPGVLSGGEKRRAALARVLAPEPDILLLDEPTNHLDLPAIEWLEETLRHNRAAMVLISHDRRFLEALSDSVLWLDRGATNRMDKGFGAFEAWRDDFIEQENTERHKLDRKIVRELHWLHRGVTARRKRNMGRLRALNVLRQQRSDQRQQVGSVNIAVGETEKSGKRVIEAKGIAKSYDGRAVVQDFSTRILRGDRVGIIGPNGAGKTTLLNMLTGTLSPDTGSVKMGTTLEMATLEQSRESLAPHVSLQDALTGGSGDSVTVGGQQRHVIGYMKDFLFAPEQARTAVSALSGGERGRLMLARALTRPANLLVLDEPTNDLDLETLDLLQEMLADFDGTVILVSHDRDFLDRVVTSTIHFEGDGRWVEYAGGYSDMLAQRGELATAEATSSKPGKKAKSKGAASQNKKSGKLSYKDKHALETLPDAMAKMEAEAAGLQNTLADPGFYTHDPKAFEQATARLGAVTQDLAQAEEEWLRLEMLREELEG